MNAEAGTGGIDEDFVLRSGVRMPCWSLAEDATARRALGASMRAAGRAEKWSGLSPDADRIWRAVLLGFAHTGRPSDLAELASAATLPEDQVAGLLRDLQRRDLLVLDGHGAVTAAYPFSAVATPHRVRLPGSSAAVHALCAIDALGMGAMLGNDAEAESSCPECGTPVVVTTRAQGRQVASVRPETALVWSGIRYADGCCATSGCTVKAFFCCEAHLEAWRARTDPDGPGFRLSVEAARQVGAALFVPMLAPGDDEPGTVRPDRRKASSRPGQNTIKGATVPRETSVPSFP